MAVRNRRINPEFFFSEESRDLPTGKTSVRKCQKVLLVACLFVICSFTCVAIPCALIQGAQLPCIPY